MAVVYGEVFIWIGRILEKNTQFVVGRGNRVRFWQDGWCGNRPLQLTFSRLYGISTDGEASIESSLTRLGAGEMRSWDV